MLIACNHPNSFLDAIIFSVLFQKPVWSLARGDVFVSKPISRILHMLHILPVFRISEGAGRLDENYGTFSRCREIFSRNGIVLIFSEGLCINEWHLRDLKKGTARLALSAWEEGIPLKVLPAGINYQSFTSFGKNIVLNFGNLISAADVQDNDGFGKTVQAFNRRLRSELTELVIEADKNDEQRIRDVFYRKPSPVKKIILYLPSAAGYLIHAPLYIPVKQFVMKKAGHTGHYDSIITGALFLLYPFYLLGIFILLSIFCGYAVGLAAILMIPVTAYCYVQLKDQF